MSKKIKLLYDITVLGDGHSTPKSRTGIFRVVEHLAIQLNEHPEIDLYYCCNNNLYAILNCNSYIKTSHQFSSEKFILPLAGRSVLKKVLAFDDLFPVAADHHHRSLVVQNILRIKFFFVFILQRFFFRKVAFKKNELSGFDIYHNPFTGLPENLYELGFKSVFITIHDMIPVLYPEFCLKSNTDLFKKLLANINRSTWICCVSSSARKDLLQYVGNSLNPDQVSVTTLAASESFYVSSDHLQNKKILDKYGIPDNNYILSLCTIDVRKNLKQVIKVFAKLIENEQLKNLNLVLAGTTGVNFEQVFSYISSNEQLKKRIIITGYLPDQDLAPIYSQALVFVYPSFYEGFGLPPLEAMQCGVPVITSNTSSLPEVVGDAGILVDPNDDVALHDAIRDLSLYSDKRAKYAAKSLERVKQFSWDRCAQQTVDQYKKSLNLNDNVLV